METRASHKNDCKRPALKEKLVMEEGDLLGLAPSVDTAVSAEEVETEEVEEPFFPTIGARVMGLEKQDGCQNGDDNDDEHQLQESLNGTNEHISCKCVNPKYVALPCESSNDSALDSLHSTDLLQQESTSSDDSDSPSVVSRSIASENGKQYLHDDLSMQNKLIYLEETIRWLMTSWLVVYRVQSNLLNECRLRVLALANRADALRQQETLTQQNISKGVQLLLTELRQKVCNLEARVEQLRRMVIRKTIESSKDVERNPACRRSKVLVCWACHQEGHKKSLHQGQVGPEFLSAKIGRNFCFQCKRWYRGQSCYHCIAM